MDKKPDDFDAYQVAAKLGWTTSASNISSHGRFILDTNWSATPLGSPKLWPSQLCLMINLVMKDPNPAAVMWGEDLTMVYNEAFVEFSGSKHPGLMGSTPKIAFAEVWSMFQGIIDQGKVEGKSTTHADRSLFLRRHGFLEEVWVTYTFIPLISEDGSVIGFHHTVQETTDRVLGQRRLSTLLAIGDHVSTAMSMNEFWSNTLTAFEDSAQDVPFAMAYSFSTPLDCGNSSSLSGDPGVQESRKCSLEGAIGIPITQVPIGLDFNDEKNILTRSAKKAMKDGKTLILHIEDGQLPSWMSVKIPGRGFDDECRAAVVMPVQPTSKTNSDGSNVIGFFILGLNPRQRYDVDYDRFHRLCFRQLATSAASVLLIEQQILRQKQLAEQLTIQEQQCQQSEARLSRFAEMATVAMYIIDPDGLLLYANNAWYEMTQHDRNSKVAMPQMAVVVDEDKPKVTEEWSKLVRDKVPISLEIRLKHPFYTKDALTGQTVSITRWILTSAYPEIDENGDLTAVFGCNTDISHQKWIESLKEEVRTSRSNIYSFHELGKKCVLSC